MCLPYMLSQMENLSDSVVANFPDAILVLNDELEIQKINPKAKKILRIRDESDVMGEHIGRLLDPEPFEMVMLKRRISCMSSCILPSTNATWNRR